MAYKALQLCFGCIFDALFRSEVFAILYAIISQNSMHLTCSKCVVSLYLSELYAYVPSALNPMPHLTCCACLMLDDFGCTHPIDGLFWSLPIYLVGFFSKYECWVSNLIMPLYHFIFWVVTCLFVSQDFISWWNV
jgi:hypothetical protein